MRFAIEKGLPYLISNGRAYPIEITDGKFRYSEKDSSTTALTGAYTLPEILARFGKNVSSIPKRGKRKTEGK